MDKVKNIIREFYNGYNQLIICCETENAKFMDLIYKMKLNIKKSIDICEKEIENNNQCQMEALDKRADLYEKLKTDKHKLSDLDTELIGIVDAINNVENEIIKNKSEIEALQEKIKKRRDKQKYWENVWWATCWIPFANIGTGIKTIKENDEYSIRAEQIRRNIISDMERINELNKTLESVRKRKRDNNESSASLTKSLTATEGSLSFITEKINELKAEMAVLKRVYEFCLYFELDISYKENIPELINENLYKLNLIKDEIMSVPITDKYIRDCIWKGDSLYCGQKLNQNEYLLSKDGRFVAVMQADNNFVVYNSEKPIWASGTYGAHGNGYIELNADNGLITLSGTDKSWNSKRNGSVKFTMQNDGNLVAYDKDNISVWATDTYTYSNVTSIRFSKFIK